MNKGSVALSTTIPTGDDALEFVEPCEQALNLPSSFVSAQHSPILGSGPFSVVSMRCNQFNALGCQRLIERITVVGAIPNKSSGSSQGDGFIERSLDKGDFMWASRSRVHPEWKTRSVCNNHELRTLAPLGLSHFRAPFFATAKVPSMKHSARSICPRSSRSRASASMILRSTPSRVQRLKRRKHVEPEGNRSGRSAQAAPVRNTHRMPLSTARLPCSSGLPRPSARRTVSGIRGSRIAHCSSVSSFFLAMQKR